VPSKCTKHESMLYRVEIWGWEIYDGNQGRFSKKMLRFSEARLMEQQNVSLVQKVTGGGLRRYAEQSNGVRLCRWGRVNSLENVIRVCCR
jgi:hypothetical protein